MIELSLTELSRALAGRRFSSVELAQCYLQRAGALNPDINAFITLDAEKTLAQARAADARIAAGEAGPLTGIPVAHKDIFCQDGWRTTCGSRMLENFIAPYSATVVERCNQAGLVSLATLVRIGVATSMYPARRAAALPPLTAISSCSVLPNSAHTVSAATSAYVATTIATG